MILEFTAGFAGSLGMTKSQRVMNPRSLTRIAFIIDIGAVGPPAPTVAPVPESNVVMPPSATFGIRWLTSGRMFGFVGR